jgi:hypothetical protein
MHWPVYNRDEFVNVERDDDGYRRCGEAILSGMREGLLWLERPRFLFDEAD